MEVKLNRKMRAMALSIEQALVLSTPVDTGRARANWQVSLDSPAKGEAKTEQGRDSRGRFTKGAYPEPAAVIAKAKEVLSTRKPEQNIFISNNVPYIRRLNEGHSAQAPAGFVEAAVQSAVNAHRGDKIL